MCVTTHRQMPPSSLKTTSYLAGLCFISVKRIHRQTVSSTHVYRVVHNIINEWVHVKVEWVSCYCRSFEVSLIVSIREKLRNCVYILQPSIETLGLRNFFNVLYRIFVERGNRLTLLWSACAPETPVSSTKKNYSRVSIIMPRLINVYVLFWR